MPNLNINSDNTIGLSAVTDKQDDSLVTSGTATVHLKTRAGEDVSGETWPLTLSYIEAGHFRGNFNDTLVLSTRQQYNATYTYDDGVDKHREWCVTYDVVCA